MRLQEHIELARASKGIEAIKYAQKHLAPWKSIEGVRIGQAMGLLAYKSDTQCQPYKVKKRKRKGDYDQILIFYYRTFMMKNDG